MNSYVPILKESSGVNRLIAPVVQGCRLLSAETGAGKLSSTQTERVNPQLALTDRTKPPTPYQLALAAFMLFSPQCIIIPNRQETATLTDCVAG